MALKVLSAAALAGGTATRYPNATADHSTTIDNIFASAEATPLPRIDAMASVKGFASVNGSLQWVQAKEHFFVSGEMISKGDFVQVSEGDAKRLVNAAKADLASDADVAAAQKAAK